MGAANSMKRVILFDGACNLCCTSVQFIVKRDKKAKFRFASLQSEFAQEIMDANALGDPGKTIVLLKDTRIFLQSDAVLEIGRDLDGLWPMLYCLKIIPSFIRDAVYDFISKRRYGWFGRTEACWLPSAGLMARFVD